MKLKILGSSSAGNCYLLDNGKECLMVECGVDFRKVQQAIGFYISRIVGCIISHEHGDHASQIKKVLQAQIPCYISRGTAEALKVENDHNVHVISENSRCRIGGFTIQPFAVQHDAREPFGYLIHHEEMGTTLFATDTYYLKYKFANLSNILIECNYTLEVLNINYEQGRIAKKQRDRTIQSHMSFETCKETLLANDLSKVNNIVLIHLSSTNSQAEQYKAEIKAITLKNVHVADKNMNIEFNKTPF